MSEEIKDLLETLVFMERNNLDHLIRTGQAIKWRKGIEQLQQENEEKAKTYAKIRDEICDYLDSHRFCENFENVGNEENVRKEILGILLKRW